MSNWHEIATIRARDVRLRLVFTVFVAVAGEFIAHGAAWPVVWVAASVAVQLLTLWIAEPMRRNRAYAVSGRRESLFYATVALSSAVFASSGALFWWESSWSGRFFAVIVLAAGAVNVAIQARASARLMWIGCAPFLLLLQVLPLMSLLFGARAEREVMAVTAFGTFLFTAHLVAAGRKSLENFGRLEQALEAARRERIRAEAASRAKSDFLGAMSHELRTPLNGVLGMAQAMAGEPLTSTQHARLDVIRESGENLLMLLNDVLDITEIETAKLQLETGTVDVPALAAQTESVFGPLAEAKGLRLTVRVLRSAGELRSGDAMRVRQVLHNLVGDSVKLTGTGKVSVVISGSAEELVFEVADTSTFPVADRLGGAFEPAPRLTPGASAAAAGLGLGIARGLARLMSGEVTVRAQPECGVILTARLLLPVARAPAGEALREAPAASGAGLRVLAAEDNPTNQLVLKTLLEQVGIAVHIVSDGEEAVEAWRSASWDLVLMDIRMPRMDGFAATRAIRDLEAGAARSRTPIIAVTADATGERAAEYMAAGMDGLAPKPIQLPQLVAVITSALGEAPIVRPSQAAASAA